MVEFFKAAYFRQLAFSIIVFSLFFSCDDSTSIGGGFIQESEIRVDTVLLTTLPFQSADPYLGQLVYSPVGSFSDPLFGDISSTLFFKPSIAEGNERGVFSEDATVRLEFRFDTTFTFGNENEVIDYNIYRASELWRGASFNMSEEITFDDTTPIASFNSNEIDSAGFVITEMTGDWKQDYITFYTDSSDSRDSVYQNLDFGLAMTASPTANQIRYLRFASTTIYLSESPSIADTTALPMLDWTYDLVRTGGVDTDGQFTLSNTYENFLYYNLEPVVQNLTTKNFVRAEFQLTADTVLVENSLGENEVRTEIPPLRFQLGPSVDIAFDLGFNASSAQSSYDSGVYSFDMTDIINANLFGNTPLEDVYIYMAQNFGILGFNSFYDISSTPENAPKMLIYSIVEGAE